MGGVGWGELILKGEKEQHKLPLGLEKVNDVLGLTSSGDLISESIV